MTPYSPAARFVLLLLVLLPSVAHAQDAIPRIINGQPTDEFPAVGVVGSQSAGGFCSGTLISPTYVLTAAHCAEFLVAADRQTGGTFQLNENIYTTLSVIIHPQYNSNTLANDIAILELSDPVVDVEPALIFRQPPQVGQQLILVGFGAGGDGANGEDGAFGEKMIGTTTLEVVEDTRIIWVFDSEDESNTAPGDSGGPAFVEVEGEFFIAGVTSSGTEPNASLGDVAADTRVDAYAAWIDSITGAAVEPPPDDEVDQICIAWIESAINWFISFVSDRFFPCRSPTASIGHHDRKPNKPVTANSRRPGRVGQSERRPATVRDARGDKKAPVSASRTTTRATNRNPYRVSQPVATRGRRQATTIRSSPTRRAAPGYRKVRGFGAER